MSKPHKSREAWLLAAVPALREMLRTAGAPGFPQPLVSVGFPRGSKKAIGQCWTIPVPAKAAKAKAAAKPGMPALSHIFVGPMLDEPARVLDVLLHELIHASVPEEKHRGRFVTIAKAVGLTGKMTATVAGDELKRDLTRLARSLGKYPHRKLDPAGELVGPKKQSTRMKKYACPHCGQIVRAATEDLAAICQPCSDESDEPVMFELAT